MPDWKEEITPQLASLKLAPAREAEIVEEVAQHLDDRYHELLAGGATEEEARRTALEEISEEKLLARGLERVEHQVAQEPVVLGAREKKNILADLGQDLRYGLRMLSKNPGFTAVAVLTLALGIGANTAVFTLISAAVLKSLPYPHSERLVLLGGSETNKPRNELALVHPTEFLEWRNYARSFEALVLTQDIPVNVEGQDGGEQISGLWTTSELFHLFGVAPALGRAFTDQETRPGENNVIILSHAYWQSHFGADRNVLGRTIKLYGQPNTVIGIMPPGFRVATLNPDVYLPMPLDPSKPEAVGSRSFQCFGRLRPGVSISSAQAEMTVIADRLSQQYPSLLKGWGVTVVDLHDDLTESSRPVLFSLLGVVGCVLLIACANLASLLMTRGVGRRSELAVRAALGADRLRLVQQMVTESVLLSTIGGALGLIVGLWGGRLLLVLGKQAVSVGQIEDVHLDLRVLGFTMALSLLTALVFGLAPAWQAARFDLHESLKGHGRGAGHRDQQRLRGALVIGEVALSVVLLVGAGLLLRTFSQLLRVSLGFVPEHVLTAHMLVSGERPQRSSLVEHILDRVEALPGVSAAGTVQFLPLGGWANQGPFHLVGEADPLAAENMVTDVAVVSRGYFSAMGIPILKGRPFDRQDQINGPRVAVVSEAFVKEYLPHSDPVGHRIIGDWSNPAPTEIVGVVGDIRHEGLTTEPRPTVYLAQVQSPGYITYLVVRTPQPPEQLAISIRHAIGEVDKNQPVTGIQGMEQYVSAKRARPRLYLALLGTFASLALGLAAVGLYGLMAYTVSQRTHEIGIRVALGATRHDVLRLVVGQGMLLAVTGALAGLAAAAALTRLMVSLLYGISSRDPLTFAAVALILLAVAFLANYLPARRATKVDPIVALRYE